MYFLHCLFIEPNSQEHSLLPVDTLQNSRLLFVSSHAQKLYVKLVLFVASDLLSPSLERG